MKKIDFHIHTISVKPWDVDFTFSMEKLRSYVDENGLDCIAITNHNKFDRKQFEDICLSLANTCILPGIEVHVLNGHVIVVGSSSDLDTIEELSKHLENRLLELDDHLSIDEFAALIKDKKLLVIPH